MAKQSFRELLYFNEVKVAGNENQNLDTDKYLNPKDIVESPNKVTYNVSSGEVQSNQNEGMTYHYTKIDLPDNDIDHTPTKSDKEVEVLQLGDNSDTFIYKELDKYRNYNDFNNLGTLSNNFIKLERGIDPDILDFNYKRTSSPGLVGDDSHEGNLTTPVNYKTAVTYKKPVAPVPEPTDWDKARGYMDKASDIIGKLSKATEMISKFSIQRKARKNGNTLSDAEISEQLESNKLLQTFNNSDTLIRYLNSMTKNHIEPLATNTKAELQDRGMDMLHQVATILNPTKSKNNNNKPLYNIIYTDKEGYDLGDVSYNPKTGDVEETGKWRKIGQELKAYFKSLLPKNPFKPNTTSQPSAPNIETLSRVTRKAITSKTINTIFDYSDRELGRLFTSFEENLKKEQRLKYCMDESTKYYREITSPYFETKSVNSPYEALRYACDSLGFSNGYHDYAGFSLGNDGIWGMTIEPYESPFGIKSLAPELPKLWVPMWRSTISEGGKAPKLEYRLFRFGETPPVLSYQINWAVARSKKIDLANESSISIPMGLSHNPTITINLMDDEHHSLRNYMGMYFNTIFKPDLGLLAPYDLASFLITITSFKPGMKVSFMFKLICVPIDYNFSYEGSETSNPSSITIIFSIVGMRAPNNSQVPVDSSLATWSNVTWRDVTVVPCNYGGMNGSGNDTKLISNTNFAGKQVIVNGG